MSNAKCRKFVPNIFNKSKCQDCFAPKELHSAEALECNKSSRKVSKCGYLFVAPDFDFTNPMDRTRRWQRRFFILYDDGELTFSVDENPDTVPQGSVDMNKCLDVHDAEGVTTHKHSMCVSSQDKTYYIKGSTKEEISRWFDILVMYPRSNIKTKRRAPSIHNLAEKENQQDGKHSKNQQNLSELRKPLETSTAENKTLGSSRFTVITHGPGSIDKGKSRIDATPFTTHRGVRSLKHKNDKAYQEGLRKSNSMYDLTEDNDPEDKLVHSRFRSRSRDRLDDLTYISDANPYATLPRTLRTSRLEMYGSSDKVNNSAGNSQGASTPVSSRDQSRGSSMHSDSTSAKRQCGVGQQKGELTHEELVGSRGNETDELKLAKGEEDLDSNWSFSEDTTTDEGEDSFNEAEELSYAKKGWLIKKGPSDTEPKKHWFVLSGDSLRYFKDSRAEDSNQLEGRIDLSTCYDISEVPSIKNYGFSVKNQNGENLLSAMTSGIRSTWMKSLGKCVEYNKQRTRSSLSSESTSSVERSPRDDVDLTRSTSDSSFVKRISALRDVPSRKLDTAKPVRRHYSDLNLRSVGDMVLVDDINIGNTGPSAVGSNRSREIHRKTRRSLTNDDTKNIKLHFLDSVDKSSSTDRRSRKSDLGLLQKKYSSDHEDLTSSKPPFRRYVEGSDSVGVSADNHKSKTGRVDDLRGRESSENLHQRAKSPSTKVKEKTRSKSPRLQSPPPGSGSGDSDQEAEIVSRSSQKLRLSRQSPSDDLDITGRNNVIVDLLEVEVESLKNQLEKTQSELHDVQISNSELKSHLHSLGHDSVHLDSLHSGQDEVDTSFDYSVDLSASQSSQRKQYRDYQDTIRRQKTEIDTLKSKLDISLSKLTKTEQELAKAVNNLKQEKEKFLRLSDDWNARIKMLEDQLRDTAISLDAKREELSSKESENKRLSNDIKSSLEKVRNSEREILKLKAVERDYKTTKEHLDNTECELAAAKAKLREHDLKLRKVEDEYEKHLEDIERQFCGDREDLEQQLENIQRQSTITDNVNSDMKDILQEKDEIISQLEEKVIETDDKMEQLSKRLETFDRKTFKAEQTASTMEERNRELLSKLKKAEKELAQLKARKDADRNSSKQADSTKKGKNQTANEIESLKAINRNLYEQNEALEASISVLNDRVADLEKRCEGKQKELDTLLRSSRVRPGSGDVLNKYDQVMEEMKLVKSKLLNLEHVIQDYNSQHGGKVPEERVLALAETTSMLGELQKRLEVTNQALKDTTLLVDDAVDNPAFQHKVTVSGSSGPQAILEEYLELKKKFDKAVFEIKKLKQEVKETEANFVKLETNEKLLRQQKNALEKDYESQVAVMNSRLNELSSKLCGVSKQALPYPSGNAGLSKELESQLNSLEHNIEFVENAMKNQDTETASLQQQIGLVEQQVGRSQDDTQGSSRPRLLPDTPTSPASPTSSKQLTAKLKQMKLQLESTNSKMKDITSKIGDKDSSQGELKSLKEKEMKLQEQILKYEDSLRQLNVEINSHSTPSTPTTTVGSRLQEVQLQLSQTECTLENCRSKLSSIIHIVESYQDKDKQPVGADSLALLKERLTEAMEAACIPVGQSEQDILKDISVKKTALDARVVLKQAEFSQLGPLSESQKQCLYAEKLACEAVILGELSYLVQKQDTKTFHSSLSRDIQDANFRLFKLEQQLGVKSDSPESNLDLDVLGSYAALIADKIIMQGKLSTLTASKSEELRHSSVMLSEGGDPQTMSLAEEVLVRSQIQDSMNNQCNNTALEPIESYAAHLTSRALIQGEITFALAQMKSRIGTRMTDKQRLDIINQELSQALDLLYHRQSAISKAVSVFRREKISKLAETLAIETLNNVSGSDLQSRQASMCELINVVMNGVRDQYLSDWSSAHKDAPQEKGAQLQKSLKEEFQYTFTELKSKYSSVLSNMTTATSKGQSLKEEIKTGLAAFCAILAQFAAVVGSTRYLNAVHKRNKLDLERDPPNPDSSSESAQRMRKILGEALMKEASTKEAKATDLRNKVRASTGQIAELAGQLPELRGWKGEALAAYAEVLLREAVFQAELTYSSLKLKMHHREELQELHEYYEAKYGRVDANESVAESYAECESFLAKPEGTLEEEHSKVTEAMKSVELMLKKLKSSLKSSASKDFQGQTDTLEKLFRQAMSVVKKTQEETTTSVMKDIKDAKSKVEEIIDDHEREKESLVAEYEDRIAQLEEEIDAIKEDHESEFDQLKQDMFTAVSAIRASEVQSEADMSNEIMRLRHQLSSQRAKVMMELKSMRSSIPHSQRNTKLASALLGKIQNVEHILTGFKSGSQESLLEITNQDFSSSSTDEESDDDSSEVSDGGEEIEEPRGAKKIDTRVHKRILLRMHERHKSQLVQLRKEKDKALEDEMKSTKAALEAMGKKYEEELQREREKFGDALTKLYTDDDMTEISKRHSLEVEHLKEEVTKLKEKFKKKNEEMKDLQEKLFKSNTEHRKEIRQLALRNDHLNTSMTKELEKLKAVASKGSEASSKASAKPDKEELYNAQVIARVKDTEVKQMKEQLKVMKERLQKSQEGQEQISSQYNELYNKYQALSTEHEEEVEKLKRKLEQALLGFRGEGKKGLRRVSSFNQRDRSPSPQRGGLKKEAAGHISRDGQRRRHRPRDLRRSKSSPSLPSISKLPMIKGKLEEVVKSPSATGGLLKSNSSRFNKP
ncbi:uncharacterized protein LOC135482313 isoform X3 [Liolophura sinensis]|uniref:uncharacterized protein LOC135482313 isoform X3 n=1 Tax=Liolophura sinensis TaxID=3198878 RepID=UPI0031589192